MLLAEPIKRMLKTYNQCRTYSDQGSFYNSSGPLCLEYQTEFERTKQFKLTWKQVKDDPAAEVMSGELLASSTGSSVTMRLDSLGAETKTKTRDYVMVFDALADIEGVIQSLVIVPQYLFYPPDEIVATGQFEDFEEFEEVVFNDEACVKFSTMNNGIRRELVLSQVDGTMRRHFMGTGLLEGGEEVLSALGAPMSNCLDIRSVKLEAGIFG